MCWDELVLGWREIEEMWSEHTSRKRGKYMLVRPQLEGQYKRWGRSDQINYTCWPLYSHKLFLKVETTSKWFLDIFISHVHTYINTSAKFAGLGLVDASVLFHGQETAGVQCSWSRLATSKTRTVWSNFCAKPANSSLLTQLPWDRGGSWRHSWVSSGSW